MLMTLPYMLEVAALVIGGAPFLLLPLELWRRRKAGRLNWSSIKEMGASVGVVLPNIVAGPLVLGFIVLLLGTAYAITPLRIPTNWVTAIACVILVDFLYYWDHRAAHRIRLLWSVTHSVHHSSPQYDQTTALRVSVMDGFTSPWFYVPAVLMGFDPLLVGAAFGFILAYQQWLHTETIGRLGWFDLIFNSPSNHRVHHGVQPEYIDKNYGAVLILWDRMFGTWVREAAEPRYGLIEPINSSNLWTVHVAEMGRLWRDLRRTRGWRNQLDLLFGPPESRSGGADA